MGNLCGFEQRGPFDRSSHAPLPVPTEWKPNFPDPFGRGNIVRVPEDQPTLACAIKAAQEGDRVLVAAGLYCETLLVDKALEIVGLGTRPADVCMKAIGATALTVCSRATCRLENIKLVVCNSYSDRSNQNHCVENSKGCSLQIERCVLEGGHSGIVNRGLAVLVQSEVRGCEGAGVQSVERSQLWMLQCNLHSHNKGLVLQVLAKLPSPSTSCGNLLCEQHLMLTD